MLSKVILLLSGIGLNVSAQNTCDCHMPVNAEETPYEQLAMIKGVGGKKIQICGIKKEGFFMGDSSYADYRWIYNLHTQFIIQGCPSGDTFLVSEGYAEESYQIEQSRHEIFLNDVAAFSGFHSLSHMAPVIINQRVIKFKNQKIYISASQPMFQIPSFTKGLVDSASRFYSRLEDTLKSVKHAQWIDYEEHPDNLLLIAALCNVGRSRVIYRNLRIFFDVDGGISETFDDKYLDYLLSNLRH